MSHIANIGFMDFAEIDGNIFFCDVFTGKIIELNLEKREFSIINQSSSMTGVRKMQYGSIEIVGFKLYFAPRNATSIIILDVTKKTINYVELKDAEKACKPLFVSTCNIKNTVYFIPGRYDSIVSIDVMSDEICYYPIKKKTQTLLTNCNTLLYKDNIIIYKYKCNEILFFDTNKKIQRVENYDLNNFRALAALKVDNILVYAGFDERILLFNENNKDIEWIDNYEQCEKPKFGIGQLIICKEEIYAFSINSPVIYKISLQFKKITKFMEYNWENEQQSVWEIFTKCDVLGCNMYSNHILFYSTIKNCIIDIDTDTKKMVYLNNIEWNKDNKKQYIETIMKENSFIYEGNISLIDYITYLIKK